VTVRFLARSCYHPTTGGWERCLFDPLLREFWLTPHGAVLNFTGSPALARYRDHFCFAVTSLFLYLSRTRVVSKGLVVLPEVLDRTPYLSIRTLPFEWHRSWLQVEG
jgi:hypothetical protein